MKYDKNCGLSEEEWELEKIVDKIKYEKSTLLCIGILREFKEKILMKIDENRNELKLIKIKNQYVVIDLLQRGEEGINYNYSLGKIDFLSRNYEEDSHEWKYCFKITHSTMPLEIRSNEYTFVKIKPLSLSEIEEAINGYSLEKMYNKPTKVDNTKCGEAFLDGHFYGFEEGFNAYKELVKDKFSLEEIGGALKELSKPQYKFDSKTTFKDLLYKQRKTEWEVTFDKQGKLKLI